MSDTPGELALVLHTHMPYVEGFGTWPFGEEWLWEAIATCYLPLLDVLDGSSVTVSLTPVLCDQLEAPGAIERCLAFLREIRPESHRLDIEEFKSAGEPGLAAVLERSAEEYAHAAERLEGLGGSGLLAALGRQAAWTSAATHAVLPLLASDAGIALQVQTGIDSHRRRFGEWGGGFWLPECAHAPWLHPLLEDAGVRSTCVELTGLFGPGAGEHLQPLKTDDGPVLWPVDRATMALVWSETGYPAAAAYRDRHNRTSHDHHACANDGRAYDAGGASAQAAADAADFVARVRNRVRHGGICVCALDTELIGHWWHEGPAWLAAVLAESDRQGLKLTTLDDALTRAEPRPAPAELPVTTWGAGGDLRTWSGPAVADLAWTTRSAELELLAHPDHGPDRALRELLALQASDWAFQASGGGAGDYPRDRARGHLAALGRALGADGAAEPALRNLAPELTGWASG